MGEWKEYKLGELYDVHNGLSKGGAFFGSGYPFLTFSTVFKNYFLPQTLDSLVQSNDKERSNFDIKRGDVFITRTSETAEELGMSSVALKDYPDATYNGFTKRLRPKDGENIVYPEFIGYYLRSPKFRGAFYGLSSSMSTRASLANGDLLNMKVYLPSSKNQQDIASILKSLDDKIENNRKINENLEQQAQALFKSWFVDFEPFRNQPFVDSELGMIPEGWRVVKLKEFLNVITGKKNANVSTKKGLYPFFSCSQDISWTDSYSFEGDAILVAGNGDFNVKFYNGKFEAYQRTYVLIPFNELYSSFLYYAIQFNLKTITSGARGSVIKFITKSNLEECTFSIPSDFVSCSILKFFRDINDKIAVIRKENDILSNLRCTLLPKLMSGELKVN